MPSSVQHGSTRPSATSSAPCVVDGRQLEFGHEAGTRRRRGRPPCCGAPAKVTAAQRGFEADQRAGRTGVGDHDQAVDVEVGWFGEPLGHRVRQGPIPRAAAQGRGGLELVGIGARVELPRAELAQHRVRQRLPQVRFGLGLLHQLVATGGFERPKRLAAILFGLVAEVENHLAHLAAANRARDSRMRCISMLPDDTVAACE